MSSAFTCEIGVRVYTHAVLLAFSASAIRMDFSCIQTDEEAQGTLQSMLTFLQSRPRGRPIHVVLPALHRPLGIRLQKSLLSHGCTVCRRRIAALA